MALRPIEGSAEATSESLLSLNELRAQLRTVGEERYHHQHPFHVMMHEGLLNRGQLQNWRKSASWITNPGEVASNVSAK